MNKEMMAEQLRRAAPRVLVGIDGMIDEVWELLESRTGAGEYTKMTRLMQLGSAITERGTGGLAKERILKRRSSGGFVCNTGRATATLGAPTTMLGTFGKTPDTVFDEFQGLCEMVSVGDPAQILVLEFSDGKVFLPNLEALINLRWENLVETLGEARLRELCKVDILGAGYWSNMYDFEHIMTALVTDYLQNGCTKRVFHDFANLNKRSAQALDDALALLGKLNAVLPQTLSLNEHEGGILARQLGISYPEEVNAEQSEQMVREAAAQIQQKTGIDEIIIHTLYFAVIATATQGAASVQQNYCTNAIKTTGAGDTFNGAYMVAAMTELPPKERLLVANAATRYYVEHAVPPTCEQLMEQLQQTDK